MALKTLGWNADRNKLIIIDKKLVSKMVYKKITSSLPSLSSILLAGIVCGSGCGPDADVKDDAPKVEENRDRNDGKLSNNPISDIPLKPGHDRAKLNEVVLKMCKHLLDVVPSYWYQAPPMCVDEAQLKVGGDVAKSVVEGLAQSLGNATCFSAAARSQLETLRLLTFKAGKTGSGVKGKDAHGQAFNLIANFQREFLGLFNRLKALYQATVLDWDSINILRGDFGKFIKNYQDANGLSKFSSGTVFISQEKGKGKESTLPDKSSKEFWDGVHDTTSSMQETLLINPVGVDCWVGAEVLDTNRYLDTVTDLEAAVSNDTTDISTKNRKLAKRGIGLSHKWKGGEEVTRIKRTHTPVYMIDLKSLINKPVSTDNKIVEFTAAVKGTAATATALAVAATPASFQSARLDSTSASKPTLESNQVSVVAQKAQSVQLGTLLFTLFKGNDDQYDIFTDFGIKKDANDVIGMSINAKNFESLVEHASKGERAFAVFLGERIAANKDLSKLFVIPRGDMHAVIFENMFAEAEQDGEAPLGNSTAGTNTIEGLDCGSFSARMLQRLVNNMCMEGLIKLDEADMPSVKKLVDQIVSISETDTNMTLRQRICRDILKDLDKNKNPLFSDDVTVIKSLKMKVNKYIRQYISGAIVAKNGDGSYEPTYFTNALRNKIIEFKNEVRKLGSKQKTDYAEIGREVNQVDNTKSFDIGIIDGEFQQNAELFKALLDAPNEFRSMLQQDEKDVDKTYKQLQMNHVISGCIKDLEKERMEYRKPFESAKKAADDAKDKANNNDEVAKKLADANVANAAAAKEAVNDNASAA